ncbi:MAG: response regulator [Blastocatellia bacterium]
MNRMLIIDDEESIRFAMSEYFKVHGYQVDCAQSVEEATAFLGTGPYSVVIADLRLTGWGNLGGLAVIKSVRERHPKTPIIVLSAYRSPEIEAEIERHSVGAFLRKPKPLPDVAQIVLGMVGCEYRNQAVPIAG